MPMKTLPLAIGPMMTAHKGNSIVQFAEEPDVIQKMALFLERRIHVACASRIPNLSKEVEIDETYIDGNHNKLIQRGAICGQPVMGTDEHNGSSRDISVEQTVGKTSKGVINDTVECYSTIHRYKHMGYTGMPKNKH